MVICATLTACATPRPDPVTTAPARPGPPVLAPVTLADLRGSADVLIFPDVPVPDAAAGAAAYIDRCLPDARRVSDPSGFSVYRAGSRDPYLRVTVAAVSRSSALGVGGTGFGPALKEALAATVQGRPRCA